MSSSLNVGKSPSPARTVLHSRACSLTRCSAYRVRAVDLIHARADCSDRGWKLVKSARWAGPRQACETSAHRRSVCVTAVHSEPSPRWSRMSERSSGGSESIGAMWRARAAPARESSGRSRGGQRQSRARAPREAIEARSSTGNTPRNRVPLKPDLPTYPHSPQTLSVASCTSRTSAVLRYSRSLMILPDSGWKCIIQQYLLSKKKN